MPDEENNNTENQPQQTWEGTVKEKVEFEDLIFRQIEAIRQSKTIQDKLANTENLEDLTSAYFDKTYQIETNKIIDEREQQLKEIENIVSADNQTKQQLRQEKKQEIDEYYSRQKFRALMRLIRSYGFTPKPKIPGEI